MYIIVRTIVMIITMILYNTYNILPSGFECMFHSKVTCITFSRQAAMLCITDPSTIWHTVHRIHTVCLADCLSVTFRLLIVMSVTFCLLIVMSVDFSTTVLGLSSVY